jgi:enolase
MFLEVQAVLAGEVGTEGLPPTASTGAGDPLRASEGDKEALGAKAITQAIEEVLTIISSPRFGHDAQVGREGDEMF